MTFRVGPQTDGCRAAFPALLLLWLLGTLGAPALAHAQPASPPESDQAASEVPPPAGAQPTGSAAAGAEVEQLRQQLNRQQAQLAEQQAQLQRLETNSSAQAPTMSEDVAPEEKLSLYGFMDVGFQKVWFTRYSGLNNVVESNASTFVLGNVNLYFDAHPVERWRALAEVRFTTYPNGQFQSSQPGQPFQRTSTEIFDSNSSSGGFAQARWGAIILERAQIEWSGADWLRVRAGYWFTPYGIWNVDHGTPTLISLNVPEFVVSEVFPARQLGVDLNGTFHPGSWDLDYHAYVSNGRTPGQVDLTEDKMFGARLALSTTRPVALTLGASGFFGRYSDTRSRTVAFAPPEFAHDEVVAYDEMGAGGDVALDVGKLRLRGEFAINRRKYDAGKHEPGWYPGAFFPSRVFWGSYLLLAYDTGIAGLEPYLYGELDRNMLPISQGIVTPSAGLNVHFTPATQLKLQYSYHRQFDFDDKGRDFSRQGLHFLTSRLVVAF